MATLARVDLPSTEKRSSTRKQRMFKLHMYAGLTASAFVVVIAITGSLLAFRPQLDRTLNPALTHVVPSGQPLSLSAIAGKLRAEHPGYSVIQMNLPLRDTDELDAVLRNPQNRVLELAVNPYTGEVLGDWANANHFMDRVMELHKFLMVRSFGEGVTKLAALAMVLLSISGVVLWTKRRKLLPTGKSTHMFALDLHSAVGIYAAVFLFVFAITALHPIPPGIFLRGLRVRDSRQAVSDKSPETRLSPEQILASAQAAVPGATPVWLDTMYRPEHQGLIVAFRYPEDRSDGGRTHVGVDPGSGKVLTVQGPRKLSPLARFALVTDMEIHTGTVWGTTSRVIACASGVLMALLAITGPLIWWLRRKNAQV